jgi:hypothetical protein
MDEDAEFAILVPGWDGILFERAPFCRERASGDDIVEYRHASLLGWFETGVQ